MPSSVRGGISGIDGGNAEHLAGTLAVAAGDERGVRVHKAALGKEPMDALGRNRTHSKRRAKGIGAGAQVLDGAQKLHAVALFLQGIIGGGGALHGDLLRMDLKGLLGLGGQQQVAGNNKRRADILAGNLIIIGQFIFLKHHLQIAEVAAVVQLDEAKGLAGAQGAHPAANSDRLRGVALRLRKQCFDLYSFHGSYPSFFPKVIYNIIVRQRAGRNPFFARNAKKCLLGQLFCKKGVAFMPVIRYNKFSSGLLLDPS